MMSLGPPAGNGTISLIGLAGKVWAEASVGNRSRIARSRLRRFFMQAL
jgi:hypothetical protein